MCKETVIKTEAEMLTFGKNFAKKLSAPACLELIGDVGVGKTTFTRGLAQGLGVAEPVTSPSFTISKVYSFPGGLLAHYDFYRLSDSGLMSDDLSESLNTVGTITVIEWADFVADVLPISRYQLTITYNDDGTRTVQEREP